MNRTIDKDDGLSTLEVLLAGFFLSVSILASAHSSFNALRAWRLARNRSTILFAHQEARAVFRFYDAKQRELKQQLSHGPDGRFLSETQCEGEIREHGRLCRLRTSFTDRKNQTTIESTVWSLSTTLAAQY